MPAVFPARYPGRCRVCRAPFPLGVFITRRAGGWSHWPSCPGEEPSGSPPRDPLSEVRNALATIDLSVIAQIEQAAELISGRAPRSAPEPICTGCYEPSSMCECSVVGPVDQEFVRWLGKLIIEEGGSEPAWEAICEMFEHWDGEENPRLEERKKFLRHLPHALRQNELIHGGRS